MIHFGIGDRLQMGAVGYLTHSYTVSLSLKRDAKRFVHYLGLVTKRVSERLGFTTKTSESAAAEKGAIEKDFQRIFEKQQLYNEFSTAAASQVQRAPNGKCAISPAVDRGLEKRYNAPNPRTLH